MPTYSISDKESWGVRGQQVHELPLVANLGNCLEGTNAFNCKEPCGFCLYLCSLTYVRFSVVVKTGIVQCGDDGHVQNGGFSGVLLKYLGICPFVICLQEKSNQFKHCMYEASNHITIIGDHFK